MTHNKIKEKGKKKSRVEQGGHLFQGLLTYSQK